MHTLLTTFAVVAGGLGGNTPLSGMSTKLVALIVAVAMVFVAGAAAKVLMRSGQGNVKRDLNVGGSVFVGIGLLVVAVLMAGFVGMLLDVGRYIGI